MQRPKDRNEFNMLEIRENRRSSNTPHVPFWDKVIEFLVLFNIHSNRVKLVLAPVAVPMRNR